MAASSYVPLFRPTRASLTSMAQSGRSPSARSHVWPPVEYRRGPSGQICSGVSRLHPRDTHGYGFILGKGPNTGLVVPGCDPATRRLWPTPVNRFHGDCEVVHDLPKLHDRQATTRTPSMRTLSRTVDGGRSRCSADDARRTWTVRGAPAAARVAALSKKVARRQGWWHRFDVPPAACKMQFLRCSA